MFKRPRGEERLWRISKQGRPLTADDNPKTRAECAAAVYQTAFA